MASTIDVDRGVHIKQIVKFDPKNAVKFDPDQMYGGITVYMYVDEPGKYFDVHGRDVAIALAKRAGFDTDRLAKVRNRQLAVRKFESDLAKELALELDEEEVILAEKGSWKVRALPMERAQVIDIETNEPVTPAPMLRADAIRLLDELVGAEDEQEKNEVKSNGSKKA